MGKIGDVVRGHLRQIGQQARMMPNFIIIGAGRSGTTSVYQYLRQHPQVCMSTIKETNYFAFLASQLSGSRISPLLPWQVTSLEDYQALFRATKKPLAIGEASPFYLFAPGVPDRIKELLPEVRLMAILRDPVERAYSAYIKNLSEGFEGRSFQQAIEDEIQGRNTTVNTTTCYVRAGQYHNLLSGYLEHFDNAQLQIYFYDDLVNSPRSFVWSIFTWLGVDANFTPNTSIRFNPGMILPIKKNAGFRRFKRLSRRLTENLPRDLYFFLHGLQQDIQGKLHRAPELGLEERRFLRGLFIEDIGRLQRLTKRDLSKWLQA
ncbi:MAG: sulfotransferase family protein [Anaerolineales bacterium]